MYKVNQTLENHQPIRDQFILQVSHARYEYLTLTAETTHLWDIPNFNSYQPLPNNVIQDSKVKYQLQHQTPPIYTYPIDSPDILALKMRYAHFIPCAFKTITDTTTIHTAFQDNYIIIQVLITYQSDSTEGVLQLPNDEPILLAISNQTPPSIIRDLTNYITATDPLFWTSYENLHTLNDYIAKNPHPYPLSENNPQGYTPGKMPHAYHTWLANNNLSYTDRVIGHQKPQITSNKFTLPNLNLTDLPK